MLLDAEFETFETDVGLQPCGSPGNVFFGVFMDGKQVPESGVMRQTNSPKSLRLARTPGIVKAQSRKPVAIAPFGRLVTWDPNRSDGARASRIQEYRAEHVIEATIIPPSNREPDDFIVLRLRHPAGKPNFALEVKGKKRRNFDARDNLVRLRPSAIPLSVRARF